MRSTRFCAHDQSARWAQRRNGRSSDMLAMRLGSLTLSPPSRPAHRVLSPHMGVEASRRRSGSSRAVRLGGGVVWRVGAMSRPGLGCIRRRCAEGPPARGRLGRASGTADQQEREEIRRLRQENYELRRANEILKSASGVFRQGARPRPHEVSRYVDGIAAASGSSRSAGRVGVRLLPPRLIAPPDRQSSLGGGRRAVGGRGRRRCCIEVAAGASQPAETER